MRSFLSFNPQFKIPGQPRAKPHEAFILRRIDVADDEDDDEREDFHMARSEFPRWYYYGAVGSERLAAARQAMQNAAAAKARAAPAEVSAEGAEVFVEEDKVKKVAGADSSLAWTFVKIVSDGRQEHIVKGASRGLERRTQVVCVVGGREGAKVCTTKAWEASLWQSSTGAIGKHLKSAASTCGKHLKSAASHAHAQYVCTHVCTMSTVRARVRVHTYVCMQGVCVHVLEKVHHFLLVKTPLFTYEKFGSTRNPSTLQQRPG